VFLINPVTLGVSTGILEVEVVNVIVELGLLEVIVVGVGRFFCIYSEVGGGSSTQKETN